MWRKIFIIFPLLLLSISHYGCAVSSNVSKDFYRPKTKIERKNPLRVCFVRPQELENFAAKRSGQTFHVGIGAAALNAMETEIKNYFES